ncbi:MAG TPA: DUF1893 domain-containing protein [Candidatus Bathyarchaeia archaeon]|nr:DUF1893 domain-containing protein [Candidatus Bathyarchaeia archaeon]
MKTTDLDLARIRFREERLTLAIAKDESIIFESKLRGVSSFLEAIERLGNRLEGSSVADKVTGRAIALLCIYSRIRTAYAETLSDSARRLLERNGIPTESDKIVERILNSHKTDVCPFEKLLKKVRNPTVAYKKLVQACSISDKRESEG